jgi:hypothetical protein
VINQFELVLRFFCVSNGVGDSLAAGLDGVARCVGPAGTGPHFTIGRTAAILTEPDRADEAAT